MKRQPSEYISGEFKITTDPEKLDLVWIHDFLTNKSYWSKGITFAVFQKSVENSLCFGVYYHDTQVGFGRVLTDFATFGYLADVFIDEKYRGRGLGKWLVECMLGEPGLYKKKRWMLLTKDAHGLYEHYGFAPISQPGNVMEKIEKK